MEDAYNPNIITVTDDDGTEHVFEELDRIETDANRYVALMPSYEDSATLLEDDGELIIVRVVEENGETFLYPIEDDEEFQNPVDLMFEDLAKRKPNHFAVRQYRLYKLAAGKTAKSILISCGARLSPFDIAELREITAYDELELDTLGDRKTALFLIMSDTDSTFNFLISMVYTQLFNLLCEKADDGVGVVLINRLEL